MNEPTLTAVVLAGSLRDRAERVLEALAAQSALDRLEVVVVDAEGAPPLAAPASLEVRTVALAPDTTFGEMRRAGAEAARAPAVAFLEDHCYPEPGWAAALVAAFEGPWAAVGYAFRNATPETWASRAAAVSEYGQWLAPLRSGERLMLAGSNVAYRRAALAPFGERLGDLLDVDFNLQHELHAAGERLYVAGDAVVAHEHFHRMRDAMRAGRAYCALLAERRSRDWGPARRIAYAVLIPVVAPVRRLQALVGALGDVTGLAGRIAANAPLIAVYFVNSALGEAGGYLRLHGDTARRFTRLELDMPRDVRA